MAQITKRQRSTLREIDKLSSERKGQIIRGSVSIGIMVVLIIAFNTLTYQMGILDPDNAILRAMIYITAMVIAGYSGIMFMRASRNQRKIDGFRQATGISRETLEAWKRGEIE